MLVSLLRREKPRTRLAGLVLATTTLLLLGALPASAATTFSVSNLSATVNGSTVSTSVTIASGARTVTDIASICVRDSDNRDVDFPGSSVSISTRGTVLTKSADFAAGTYRYWGCVYVAGAWNDIGAPQTFTVGTGTARTATSSSSGTALPVGNLPGWTQTFTEDFTTPVARGSFPGAYAKQWMSYSGFEDAFHAGYFDQSIISAQDGNLDLYLHTANGRALGAAPIPLVNGQWGGQTYGKFSVRMRSDELPGFGTGFLLWPDSGNWNEGEIDFPESSLAEGVKGYNHCLNAPASNCMIADTDYRYSDWHTYSIEWTPSRLSFLIDDTVIGTTTNNIPSKPLHWVMQVATHGTPAANTAGHFYIDWVSIYKYAG